MNNDFFTNSDTMLKYLRKLALGYHCAILMSYSCLLKVYYKIFVWLKLQLTFKTDEEKTGNQKETHILFFKLRGWTKEVGVRAELRGTCQRVNQKMVKIYYTKKE